MKIAAGSYKSLLIEMRFNEQKLSMGTGFVVETSSGPHLITNRHNVTGRDQNTNKPLSEQGGTPDNIVIMHNSSVEGYGWISHAEDLYYDETPLWIEHPRLGAKADFVALKLTKLDNIKVLSYDPSDPGPDILLGPADIVSVIGFPFGKTAGKNYAIWATGFLASEPNVDYDELPIQLIDCRTRPGQSGSPVIAYRIGGGIPTSDGNLTIFNGPVERFLGIYSGRINNESDIGMFWKASAIDELVRSVQS